MVLRFRLRRDGGGDWASFLPVIGAWSDDRLSIASGDNGPGMPLAATARPLTADSTGAPAGPGIFALRWFECAAADADEFVALSEAAWPVFETGTPGARIYGLFRGLDLPGDTATLLLCTRYPSLAAWESSRADTRSAEFRRRAQLTRRTEVSLWRLAPPPPSSP